MHIKDYFINTYKDLQNLRKKLKDAINTLPKQIDDSEKNHEKKNLEKQNSKKYPEENFEKTEEENPEKNPEENLEENNEESFEKKTEENQKKSENKIVDEMVILKMLYRELILYYHPDKNNNTDGQIFYEIKESWDRNYYPTILYYYIEIFDLMEYALLEKYLRIMRNEINQTKSMIYAILHQVP